MGSPEKFVIGVAAVGKDGFYLERANALHRLECLYGSSAETAIFASEVALDEFAADLAERAEDAIARPLPSFSGISFGPVSEGEARSIVELAQMWMKTLSSLYNADRLSALEIVAEQQMVAVEQTVVAERLPSLVFTYVASQKPSYDKYFSRDIREQRRRRRRSNAHDVVIDFTGSHLVANFGTLKTSSRAASYDKIKSRMWELKVNRDKEGSLARKRTHEMIIQRPSSDDPQVTEKQAEEIENAVIDLSSQAKQEELAFSSYTTVKQIGEYVLNAETVN